MKRVLKWFGGLLGAAVVLAVLAFVQVWYFKPFKIDIFFEKAFLKAVLSDPETLSSLRFLDKMGIHSHNDDLTESSPARQERLAAQTRDNLETLHDYDRASLDATDAMSYDILDWFLTNNVEGQRWMWHNYPVNPTFGVQNSLPTFMISTHQVTSAGTARDYVARLSKFRWKFGHVLDGLKLRESKGVLPPKFAVEKVLDGMRSFIKPAPKDHVLVTNLRDKLDKLGGVSDEEKQQILAAGEKAIAESVVPAYQDLIGWFESIQPKVTASNGVWSLPDGDEYYAWCVRNHTTLPLTADQVHETGLKEVA
ncbi:MAG: DUF885 domain-containing protein, partial [Nevskiaceae bacterium]